MEGLSIAASLIAVIQLTGKVSFLCYGYISKVGQAQQDIESFLEELTSLGKFLGLIDSYVKADPATSDALQALDKPLDTCMRELENLESKLKPKKTKRAWFKKKMGLTSLMWPLKEKEVTEIISRIERNKTSFLLALSLDNISQLRANLVAQSSLRQADDSARAGETRKKALNWLYSGDFERTHTQIGSVRKKDTGGWLLKSQSFQKLVKGEQGSRLLWGYGIPGAGKTFLSYAVVDHLLSQTQQKGYGVAYFYFNYKEKEQQSPDIVISSLLKQLASQLLHLPKQISELYKLEEENKRPTLAQLVEVFFATFKFFGKVFIVFDALDECDEHSQRGKLLPLFHEMAGAGAGLFITSRHHPEDIQESFKVVAKIELSAKNDDIKSYIEERIEKNARAKRLVHDGKFGDRIVSQLTKCANGMFLAVRFHLDYLCQQTTVKQIFTALETLKDHIVGENLLDPTYDRVKEAILNQPKKCAELAIRILSWLVHTKRVLTIKEIQTAVSIEPGRYELDDSDLPDIKTMLDVCFGLVSIDENSGTIRLSHLTVHDYLMRDPVLLKDAILNVAIACTTYNSFSIFSEFMPHEFVNRVDLWEARLKPYPFLAYSALFMSSHLKSCEEESTQSVVLEFLKRSGCLNFWVLATYYLGKKTKTYRRYPIFSDRDGAEGLPRGWPFSSFYSKVWTPLEGASRIGHALLVQRLLMEGYDSPIAVRLAASGGHGDVVRLLVDNGVSASGIPDHNGNLPQHFAVKIGADIVNLLLDRGAKINARDNSGGTALHNAASDGHEAIVGLLLDRGADIEAKNESGRTALHYAALDGHEAIVGLLLDRGADIEAKEEDGWTALHNAASGGHEAIVGLLLDWGADIEAKDESGWTALHCAALDGDEATVGLLLDRGADIEAKEEEDGRTALYYAASSGHEATAGLLLDRGADIEAKCRYGWTALHSAASGGHEATVGLLLDRGVDIEAKDESGRTALHNAASDGHEATVGLLLDRGADIEAKDESGRTALHCAALDGDEATVGLLLDRGADIEAKDESGRTALH